MLDKTSCDVLRFIKEHKSATNKDIQNKFHSEMLDELSYLEKNNYISATIEDVEVTHGFMRASVTSYCITPHGRACLEARTCEKFKVLYPYIVSTLALLLSLFNTLKIYNVL